MFGFRRKTLEVRPDPGVQAQFVQRAQAFSGEFLQALGPGERAAFDYTPATLERLDAVLARARAGALVLTPLQRVGMAAYLYEVARCSLGGRYEVCDDEDPVVLVAGRARDGACLCAISHVERCLSGGEPEPLAALYARYAAAVAAGRTDVVA